MAVTIIGNTKDIPQQVTHSSCGSILEFYAADIQWGSTEASRSQNYRYVVCPKCIEECAHAPKAARVKLDEVDGL